MNAPVRLLLAAAVCCSAFAAMAGENVDPSNDNPQFAWGENIGWINARRVDRGFWAGAVALQKEGAISQPVPISVERPRSLFTEMMFDMRRINELGGYLHLVMSIPGLAAH